MIQANNQQAILYSFRRCPYAIRARLTIEISGIDVDIREVLLKEKPQAMLTVSPKGTVPVLVLADGHVIDESIDIMRWALQQSDPDHWLCNDMTITDHLIELNDGEFKQHLDHYKYADRFPEQSIETYRQHAECFLKILEQQLNKNQYLVSEQFTLADAAIFPFIRQFAFVDKGWFDDSLYTKLQHWLARILHRDIFNSVMKKQPQWLENNAPNSTADNN